MYENLGEDIGQSSTVYVLRFILDFQYTAWFRNEGDSKTKTEAIFRTATPRENQRTGRQNSKWQF